MKRKSRRQNRRDFKASMLALAGVLAALAVVINALAEVAKAMKGLAQAFGLQ